MRYALLLLLLISYCFADSQSLLDAYKKFRITQADSIYNDDLKRNLYNKRELKEGRKRQLIFIKRQLAELDTMFKAYKNIHGFDFNIADSLLIYCETSIESSLNDFIIIHDKDSLCFGEDFTGSIPLKLKTNLKSNQYLFETPVSYPISYTTQADTLITLIKKGDVVTARKIEKEHPVLDGAGATIIIVNKIRSRYIFHKYSFQAIGYVKKH